MKQIFNNKAIAAAALIGGALGVLFSILCALLLTWLISSERLGQGGVDTGSLVILLVGSAAASVVSTLLFREKRLLVCVLSAVCFALIMLAMTAVFFGGQYSGLLPSGLVILAGSGCVCILGAVPQKKHNHGRRKVKNR